MYLTHGNSQFVVELVPLQSRPSRDAIASSVFSISILHTRSQRDSNMPTRAFLYCNCQPFKILTNNQAWRTEHRTSFWMEVGIRMDCFGMAYLLKKRLFTNTKDWCRNRTITAYNSDTSWVIRAEGRIVRYKWILGMLRPRSTNISEIRLRSVMWLIDTLTQIITESHLKRYVLHTWTSHRIEPHMKEVNSVCPWKKISKTCP